MNWTYDNELGLRQLTVEKRHYFICAGLTSSNHMLASRRLLLLILSAFLLLIPSVS